jgi:hypothetical protein
LIRKLAAGATLTVFRVGRDWHWSAVRGNGVDVGSEPKVHTPLELWR